MRVFHNLAVFSVILAAAVPSWANDAEQADALFKKGTKLFADGKVDEACDLLEESERLDHNGSTLYNLGICREEQGRMASAQVAFNAALELARAQKKTAREKSCVEHLAALEPKLSKIAVVVPAGVAVDGFEVTIDGKRLDPAEWGAARSIDPGPHAIAAKAPGKKPFDASVTVGRLADRVTLTITPLVDEPAATPTNPPSPPTTTSTTEVSTHDDVPSSRSSSQRTLAFIVGGAGVVVAGVGGYFLIHAESVRSDASGARDAGDVEGANALLEDARKNRTLGFVGVGVGVAAIGAGVVLLVTSPSSEPPPRVQVVPNVGPTMGGLSLVGRF